jgi:hypothetical protein
VAQSVRLRRDWSGSDQVLASGHEGPADPGGAAGLPGQVEGLAVLAPPLLLTQGPVPPLGGRPGPRAEVRQPLQQAEGISPHHGDAEGTAIFDSGREIRSDSRSDHFCLQYLIQQIVFVDFSDFFCPGHPKIPYFTKSFYLLTKNGLYLAVVAHSRSAWLSINVLKDRVYPRSGDHKRSSSSSAAWRQIWATETILPDFTLFY